MINPIYIYEPNTSLQWIYSVKYHSLVVVSTDLALFRLVFKSSLTQLFWSSTLGENANTNPAADYTD